MDPPRRSRTRDLAVAALEFSNALHKTTRGFQIKHARALKAKVTELIQALNSLLETITVHSNLDFRPLERLLQRCGNTCKDCHEMIIQHSSDTSRSGVPDWIAQESLQEDINDFSTKLSAHISTIKIAIAIINLSVTPNPSGILTVLDLSTHTLTLADV